MPSPKTSTSPGHRLGRYLKHCRVKVIDQDTFPSSFYAQEIEEDVEAISQTGLFVEYVKLVLEQPGNTWRFWITVIFDQLKNIYVSSAAFLFPFLFACAPFFPEFWQHLFDLWLGLFFQFQIASQLDQFYFFEHDPGLVYFESLRIYGECRFRAQRGCRRWVANQRWSRENCAGAWSHALWLQKFWWGERWTTGWVGCCRLNWLESDVNEHIQYWTLHGLYSDV